MRTTAYLIVWMLAAAGAPTFSQVWPLGADLVTSGEPTDRLFGQTVAVLDFDGDGDLEIAVGDPRAVDANGDDRPIVRIFAETQFGWQAFHSFDLGGRVDLGSALAAGDFDEDGRDDLLIGAPGFGSGGGAVYLMRHTSPTVIVIETVVSNGGESGGRCGTSLAVGDFDDDGNLDFATGCPLATFDGFTDVGRIQVFRGFGTGVFSGGFLSQNSPDIAGGPEPGDLFGFSVAVGNFNGDDFDDLAIGVPGEDVDGGVDTGAIHVLYGSGTGLSGSGSQLWHQGSTGVPGVSGDDDDFGWSLAAGDFDRLGFLPPLFDDLAIGIPGDAENPGGSVLVLYGSVAGLTTDGVQSLTATNLAPPTQPGVDHRLGARLVAGKLDDGSTTDLVITAEGGPGFPISFDGSVCIVYGTGGQGIGPQSSCFSGGDDELPGADGADFGAGLAIGKIDGPSAPPSLLIGSPESATVYVLHHALFADGFELGYAGRWVSND